MPAGQPLARLCLLGLSLLAGFGPPGVHEAPEFPLCTTPSGPHEGLIRGPVE